MLPGLPALVSSLWHLGSGMASSHLEYLALGKALYIVTSFQAPTPP